MRIARRLPTGAGVLAALVALSGCDAILGLGVAPPEGDAGATATSSSTGATTNSSGEPSSTGSGSSSGGGEGGAQTSTSSTGGGGQGGAGGAPPGAPCGSCSANSTSCELCAEGQDRCLVRTWRLPETEGSVASPQGIINRFGRGLAVTDEVVVFTRNVTSEGSPKHVATVVSRADGSTSGVDLGLSESLGIGAAAASADRIVVSELGSTAGPLYEVTLGEAPTLVERISAFTLDESVRMGPIVWTGDGQRFVYAHRFAGTLHGFDLEDLAGPCLVADATTFTTPSDILAHGGGVVVARYLEHFVARTSGNACGSDDQVAAPPTRQIDLINAIAADGSALLVQGMAPGGGSIVLRDDGGPTLPTYPSAALAVRDGSVFLAHPSGGIRRCPASLEVSSASDCVEIASAEVAGRGALFEATPHGLIALGYVGVEGPDSIGEAIVTCVDDR